MITVEIQGKPVVWKAPVVTRSKGTYSHHTKAKQAAQWQLKSQFNQDPWECALCVSVKFYFLPPKSTSYVKKMQMLRGETPFNKRPDISNLEKFCLDVGNGVLWRDDAQIIKLTASKLYGTTTKTLLSMEPYSEWEGGQL